MSEHEERGHSAFGGSSIGRVLACPGSVALAETVPPAPDSRYAAEGTAAHSLAELCLRRNDHPSAYIGLEMPNGYVVTDEMAQAVVVYLNAVTAELAKSKTAEYYVEAGFDLPLSTAEPGEVFGTNDALVYHPDLKRIAVFDYKHGAGVVVDVEDNAQLKFYAAGALLSNPTWPVHDIELFVVQPRAFDEGGDGVKRWTFAPEDLIEFIGELERGVAAAKTPDAPLRTGSHCRWCDAAAVCPAREAEILDAMQLAVADLGAVTMADLPELTDVDTARIAGILRGAELLSAWAAQVSEFAEGLLMRGTPVPGYKIVEKLARRKWIGDEADIAATLSLVYGLDEDVVLPRRLVTITEAEKLLKAAIPAGAERTKALDAITLDFTIKESSGTTMVPTSDKRPAVDVVANALQGLPSDGQD